MVIQFNAANTYRKRTGSRTEFMKSLAKEVGTSLSNVYNIIRDATINVRDSLLRERTELSAIAAYNKRSHKTKRQKNFKFEKAHDFIKKVEEAVLSSPYCSIDETINSLKLHKRDEISGMETICTKTFYNYVHLGLVNVKPIDLPRMIRRKTNHSYKTYIAKNQKGDPVTERSAKANSREEFGHWEGDLVTGPRDGKNGAYLTLIERKTRFYLMIPIKRKSSKKVYMAINTLEKHYGDDFKAIFKSITFDNGSEFSRWKDIEKRPGAREFRTKVYFGRPYRSCDRGSNENCNGLIRYVIKKGTDINKIDLQKSIDINKSINNKPRKILGYRTAESCFIQELEKLKISNNTIFYS